VAEVTARLQKSFIPTDDEINARIEKLIEREFLAREDRKWVNNLFQNLEFTSSLCP